MILIDLETRSSCDLRAEGGRRYAAHPSTHLLTVAWIHGESRNVWFPTLTVRPPEHLLQTQIPGAVVFVGQQNPLPDGTLVAHNAWGFDSHFFPDRDWVDTEPLARRLGLPGGIDAIGERLRGVGKYKEGKSRLLKFSKGDSKPPMVGDLCVIAKYNLDDVEILKLAWEYIQKHDNLPERENRVLRVHRRINDRGIRLDLGLCQKLADLSLESNRRTVKEIATLTGGKLGSLEDLRSRTKMFEWIAEEGARVGTSLRKDTIETLFRENEDEEEEGEDSGAEVRLTPLTRQVLQLRFSALRISTAKVSSAMKAVHNGRLHDILVYFGALPGRWAGRRLQPQNLPTPKPGVDPWEVLKTDFSPEAVSATLFQVPGYPMPTLDDAIAACIRMILLPDDGYFFAPSDYNAIEARGVAWIAEEDKLLDMFRTGKCPYLWFASKVYGTPVTDKKDPRRKVGKVGILGCQYQLGEEKMAMYALGQGVDLEAAGVTASQVVNAYRDAFPKIAGEVGDRGYRHGGLWNELNYNAIKACHSGRASYLGVEFRHDGRELRMYLPSGRPVCYQGARVEDVVPKWGGRPKPTIVYQRPQGSLGFLHGGVLTNNLVQGSMRDVLADAMVRMEEENHPVLLHVHDEAVPMVRDQAEAKECGRLMAIKESWATGLPISVETDTMPRYSKSPPKGWDSYVHTS